MSMISRTNWPLAKMQGRPKRKHAKDMIRVTVGFLVRRLGKASYRDTRAVSKSANSESRPVIKTY